nr:NADH dehydrogenase subunit 5 [Polysiphonia sp.]
MYLLVIFFPLFSSLSLSVFGRWLGFYGSSYISVFCLLMTFVLSILIFFEISLNDHVVYIDLMTWIISDNFLVKWNFLFDSLTTVMLLIVSFISLLVHIYSLDYMKLDPHIPRFLSFLSIFTFFMLILVTSGNFLQLFLGWEGVGLASYLLINFWFTRLSANKAALKALIVNRIGDLGILIAILLILQLFEGSLNFTTIFALVPLTNNYYIFDFHYLSIISFFLLIGAIGKSAQLGLHTWLPDAMEGPTPVSALIHAATMVTAGVFLIIRFSPLIEFSLFILNLLIVFGSLTAFFAAFTGIFQHDIKKVIAYSTCSQLGYMIFCCGFSAYNISLFHLFNHAFFKALLFLSAGSVIHAIQDEQDMRRMGSLISFLPITYSVMLIGSFALIGFPFLTGFYSKDLILEVANVFRNSNLHLFTGTLAVWLGTLAAFFTAFYSFRLLFLTFVNNNNSFRNVMFSISEAPLITLCVLSLLGFCSLFVGYFGKEFFVGLGNVSWNHSLFAWSKFTYSVESEFLLIKLKWIPFIFTFAGFMLSVILNLSIIHFSSSLSLFHHFFFLVNKKSFFDFFYNRLIVYPLLSFGYLISYKNLDRGFLELSGPIGLTHLTSKFTRFLHHLQTGYLIHYIFFCILILLVSIKFSLLIYSIKYTYLFLIFFIAMFYKL